MKNSYNIENPTIPQLNGIFAAIRDGIGKDLKISVKDNFYQPCKVTGNFEEGLVVTGSNIGVGIDYIVHRFASHSFKTLQVADCFIEDGVATTIIEAALGDYKPRLVLTFEVV